MSTARKINIFNAYLRLMITLITGVLRIAMQLIYLVPKVFSKLLSLLIKIGVVYKLLIDPALRSVGSFFAGLWRAWMQKRASSKSNREGEMKL
jgi:hypothetical protein